MQITENYYDCRITNPFINLDQTALDSKPHDYAVSGVNDANALVTILHNQLVTNMKLLKDYAKLQTLVFGQL
jgi:hypothetical protein